MIYNKLCVFALVLSVYGQSSISHEDSTSLSWNETLLESSYDFTTCGSIATKGADYRGDISYTENGIPCQNWNEQFPNKHSYTTTRYPGKGLGNHNKCRNPDGSPAPWCFTVSSEERWERCEVPRCEKTLNYNKINEIRKKLEEEAEDAKSDFDNYFENVRDLNNLCQMFKTDYNNELCEKDFLPGKRKDNQHGFDDEVKTSSVLRNQYSPWINEKMNSKNGITKVKTVGEDKERLERLSITKNIRGYNIANEDDKVDRLTTEPHKISKKDMCLIFPLNQASTADALFKKKITVLIADPKYKKDSYEESFKSLQHFNYCTDNMIIFSMDPREINVNVSGMNWMEATYQVLEAASEKGFIDHKEKNKYMKNSKKIYTSFNTKKMMTMVILPDDVDFEGAYGFAILHNGLSVIRAEQAKNPTSILHEVGHSLGMRHSSSPTGGTYGDDRCIMGNAKDESICFNAQKSVYLGLYREYTGIVYPLQDQCEAVLTIVDVKHHLYKSKNLFDEWGRYYVIIQIPYEDSATSLHLMYYGDEDNQFLSATEGVIETAFDTKAHHVSVASTSQRIFDLKVGETKQHNGILYNLCETIDKNIARIMMTYDINAVLTCPSKNPIKTNLKDPVLDVRSVVNSWYSDRESTEAIYGRISDWDTSKVTTMHKAFWYKHDFNEDISRWDTSNVTSMYGVFYRAQSFNQDISRWDISKVISMYFAFYYAESFNQNISRWDVSKCKYMSYMFYGAAAFWQKLCWDMSGKYQHNMFNNNGGSIGC